MPKGYLGFPRAAAFGPLTRETENELRSNWNACPTEGKEKQICQSIKNHSIQVLKDDPLKSSFIHGHCKDLEDINSGRCGIVAYKVYTDLNGSVNMVQLGYGEHFWISYNGKHYDAEVPTGVSNPKDLPIMDRISMSVVMASTKAEADAVGDPIPNNFQDLIRAVDVDKMVK